MDSIDRLRHVDGRPDPYEIVEEFWPYDGPHDNADAASVLVARLVRYMNNATQPGYPGVPNAPTLGRIVGNVTATAYALDQLLDQLAQAAERFANDPTLYDDQAPREQGGDTARELDIELRVARHNARTLATALDRANALGSRLGHRSAGETS